MVNKIVNKWRDLITILNGRTDSINLKSSIIGYFYYFYSYLSKYVRGLGVEWTELKMEEAIITRKIS